MKNIFNKIKMFFIKNWLFILKQLTTTILLITIITMFLTTISSSINLGDDFYILSKMKFITFIKTFETKWFIFFIIVIVFIFIYQIHSIVEQIKPNKISLSFDISSVVLLIVIFSFNIIFFTSFNNLYFNDSWSSINQKHFWLIMLLILNNCLSFLIIIDIISIVKNVKSNLNSKTKK